MIGCPNRVPNPPPMTDSSKKPMRNRVIRTILEMLKYDAEHFYFVVSCSIMIKFGVVTEFNKVLAKINQ